MDSNRHDNVTREERGHLVSALDRTIVRAVREYVARYRVTTSDMRHAERELNRLSMPRHVGGGDPDYNVKGLPVAYAFRFLAQRTVCLYGCFAAVPPDAGASIVDVGSGQDATSLALSLSRVHATITTIEPGAAMRQFADSIPVRQGLTRARYPSSWQSYLTRPGATADMVVLSTALPFEGTDFTALARGIQGHRNAGSHLVAIEPEVKKSELVASAGALGSIGWATSIRADHAYLGDVLKKPVLLPRSTSLRRSLRPATSPIAPPVMTWTNDRTDFILSAVRHHGREAQ